jgi:hypothetical protein
VGSAHPKARHAAPQEGSVNLVKLFKKEGFYSRFEAVMKDTGTIVADPTDRSRNPERLAALADTDLPDSNAASSRWRKPIPCPPPNTGVRSRSATF